MTIKTTKILSAVKIVSFVYLFYALYAYVVSNFQFENLYLKYWELSDKSSTILAKKQYIEKFVFSLKEGYTNGHFSSHNAILLKTLNNEFISNLKALESLSLRLEEIEKLSPASFEYNTAIQQITAQEQGEASDLISVLKGCFLLKNYFLIWSYVGAFFISVSFAVLTGCLMTWLILKIEQNMRF